MSTPAIYLRLSAVVALLVGSGASYSADGCNSTCRRDLAALRQAVKTVNGHLSKTSDVLRSPRAADIDAVAMAYRSAAAALKNARSSSRTERLELLYARWQAYLDTQANCLTARATPLRAWESNGGWSGFAGSVVTGSVFRLLSQAADGVKNNDAIMEQCRTSRDALVALKGTDVGPDLNGAVFTIDIQPETRGQLWESAYQFRLVTEGT